MNQKLKLLLWNLAIVLVAVVTYSDGLLGLRPSDPSILKAGRSILIGLGLGAALIGGNIRLLRGPGAVQPRQLESAADVADTMRRLTGSRYFGDLAKTGVEQYDRLQASARRATQSIHLKFQRGSMSAGRYVGAVTAAENAAMDNMKTMALRMSVFSDAEYERLLNYKNDDIPDDIQEQQLALYDKSLNYVRRSISVNETLILKLDTLAFDMSDAAAKDAVDTDALLEEISALTSELKFYQ